jgi:ArsR family transcriptional regulator
VDRACDSLDELLGSGLFKALSDPNRARLFVALAGKCRDCSVGELGQCLTVDVSVVSRHLAQLRAAGVLHAEKRGKQVRYSILFTRLGETLRGIADAIDECCPPGMDGCSGGSCGCAPTAITQRKKTTHKGVRR